MSAGQMRSSATAPLPREARQVADLLLEAPDFERDDHEVRQHRREKDEVRGKDVLLCARHASRSRSSLSETSIRLPASSTRYSVAASASIPARQTQNARNISHGMATPSSCVNTVGCRIVPAIRTARKLTGISATPKSAYTAELRSLRGPGSVEKRSMKYAE